MIIEHKYYKEFVDEETGKRRIYRPNEIVMDNGVTYVFITNIRIKQHIDLYEAAKLLGYEVIFFAGPASNMYGEAMSGYLSCYMRKCDFEIPYSCNRLFQVTTEIAIQYRQALATKGYDVSNLNIVDVHLGCEKDLKLKKLEENNNGEG